MVAVVSFIQGRAVWVLRTGADKHFIPYFGVAMIDTPTFSVIGKEIRFDYQFFLLTMRCPKCACEDDKVIDSRSSREGATIRRRRECLKCSHRFTTYEQIEHKGLMVIKRDERREEFTKEKLLKGVHSACEKRPISAEAIEETVEKIVNDIAAQYEIEVPCSVIGNHVMEALRNLDQVAYVRFASVYRRFEDAGEFLKAVKNLEVSHDTATIRLPGI